ncbi:MAG: corrinoid protein [Desulfobacteraceae bacterium]|jgi:methanogenic corrinoid protein MtbC1
MSKLDEVKELTEKGKQKLIAEAVQGALDEGSSPTEILDTMIEAMAIVGDKFKKSEIFVPEMLMAAHTMKKGVEVIQPLMVGEASTSLGTCVIGTVSGDLHDIGKNLVSLMIESAGFTVVDLGVDVSTDKFIEAINSNTDCKVAALSCLLTTTMPALSDSVKGLIDAGIKDKVKIIVGGAPITQDYANEIGADGYAEDAASAADLAKSIIQ